MYTFELKKAFYCLLLLVGMTIVINGQNLIADTNQIAQKPNYNYRISAGPSIIAIDNGYYLQNEFLIDFSKNFSLLVSIGTGNAYKGIRNVQKWYLPGAVPTDDDNIRHQSVVSLNAGMQLSLINTLKHRVFAGVGPGLNYYNYSEGRVKTYGDSTLTILSNKQTLRMSINYFAGYEYKAFDHMTFGLEFYSSQFTEMLYCVLLTTGYRF